MQLPPLLDQAKRPGVDVAFDGSSFDLDSDFLSLIFGMEMRWSMVAPVHVDDNPKESTDDKALSVRNAGFGTDQVRAKGVWGSWWSLLGSLVPLSCGSRELGLADPFEWRSEPFRLAALSNSSSGALSLQSWFPDLVRQPLQRSTPACKYSSLTFLSGWIAAPKSV